MRIAECVQANNTCELAKAGETCELDELSCPFGNDPCGLRWVDDEASVAIETRTGGQASAFGRLAGRNQSSTWFQDFIDTLTDGPWGRVIAIAVVVLGTLTWLALGDSGGPESTPTSSQTPLSETRPAIAPKPTPVASGSSHADCAQVPSLPAAVEEAPSLELSKAIRERPTLFVACGHGGVAAALLREAANTGDRSAMLALGDLYNPLLRTTAGSDQALASYERAYTYYLKAARQGEAAGACRLSELKLSVDTRAEKGHRDAINLLSVWAKDLPSCLP